jgi:hypothetical protein
MQKSFAIMLLVLSLAFRSSGADFKWKIVTNPYRNYIYPGQTGLQYNLNYSYNTESKALRNYLKNNYDVRSSESIGRIFKDISTGVYFDRYFDIKIKYIKSTDTLVLVVKYENGDSTLEKYSNISGTTKIYLPLTKYKMQHDFSVGKVRSAKQKGLVSSVNIFVRSNRYTNDHISVLTKLVTEADMPGMLSRIKGKSIHKK